jgi:hypothetical protein
MRRTPNKNFRRVYFIQALMMGGNILLPSLQALSAQKDNICHNQCGLSIIKAARGELTPEIQTKVPSYSEQSPWLFFPT